MLADPTVVDVAEQTILDSSTPLADLLRSD
jgi:hypothetical protein